MEKIQKLENKKEVKEKERKNKEREGSNCTETNVLKLRIFDFFCDF